MTRGLRTTCASKILGDWEPPYDATVTTKIKEARSPSSAGSAWTEFAMGSSATSRVRRDQEPVGRRRIPGGSGGGSAAAVAAHEFGLG